MSIRWAQRMMMNNMLACCEVLFQFSLLSNLSPLIIFNFDYSIAMILRLLKSLNQITLEICTQQTKTIEWCHCRTIFFDYLIQRLDRNTFFKKKNVFHSISSTLWACIQNGVQNSNTTCHEIIQCVEPFQWHIWNFVRAEKNGYYDPYFIATWNYV